ncbi:hypothetical protein O6H91_14G050900 [Diphasiastrum complanatum]|uniref:Uncharacterized protein n=1 Tax=Diphasiastrum complanatum TaxID=34168 RepID=A0ACC2BP98_DIPCM|nr:hypothetical protein O6H91_14G050900 [Diphasiastrum complanatum]
MLYAGVEHIYSYDTAHTDAESQKESLKTYVQAGLLSYIRFYHTYLWKDGADFHYEQDNSYQHFLVNYGASTSWALEMDVDEYPFMPSDLQPSFVRRYLLKLEEVRPTVSQVLLQCMIFAGKPQGDPEQDWVIERYQRRKHQTEGKVPGSSRQKPIFRPSMSSGRVVSFKPHIFSMKQGETSVAPADEVRMNHYWGARVTNFGPDTVEILNVLEVDNSIQPIATRLRKHSLRNSWPNYRMVR